jgi:hypothetical protein
MHTVAETFESATELEPMSPDASGGPLRLQRMYVRYSDGEINMDPVCSALADTESVFFGW